MRFGCGEMFVVVWDHDKLTKNEQVGATTVFNIDEVIRVGRLNLELTLKNKSRGLLHINSK